MAGIEVQVTSTDLRQAYLDLKAAQSELMPELRKGMKAAAKPLVDSVKREAATVSSRTIPGAVSAKVSFSAKAAGVAVRVDAKRAPHARPINNNDSGGVFRHPVFADARNQVRREWTWVTQAAHPFWRRGIDKADAGVDKAMLAVLDAVAAKAGFK